jgi:hypothetical protein
MIWIATKRLFISQHISIFLKGYREDSNDSCGILNMYYPYIAETTDGKERKERQIPITKDNHSSTFPYTLHPLNPLPDFSL